MGDDPVSRKNSSEGSRNILSEPDLLDPPPGVPKNAKRDGSPHPSQATRLREATASDGPSVGSSPCPSPPPLPSNPASPTNDSDRADSGPAALEASESRGSLLLKRRGTSSSVSSSRPSKKHDPLLVYSPPIELPSAEQLMGTFKDRLSHQRQTVHSPAEIDALDVPAILKCISEHDVTFINTQTGSGKSTLVPKAIMASDADYRVVTTQPRRTATIRLADTVASMCNQNVGEDEIGYWIRGDRCGGQHTRLWYMTSYTLLLHLLNNRMAPPFTHIIIDEFHERQPEIEVLVALLRLLLQKPRGKSQGFKLILMSATLNTEAWEGFFKGLSWGIYSNDNQRYTVHDYYLEEASLLTGAALRRPATFNQTVVNPDMHDNSLYVAQQLIRLIIKESSLKHSILVFLPGRASVSKMRRWIDAHLSHRLYPIPWHGSVELAWIQQQISQEVEGLQKVYLATDVAEVSITLPDVVFVIDTCLVKRPHINEREPATILHPQLVQQWASKGSALQRQGRVGRTQQGFYFCLLPVEYAKMLDEYPAPPICHSRLDDLTLHLLHVCQSPRALFTLCKRPPTDEALKVSIRALQEIGAIYKTENAERTVPGTNAEDGFLSWSTDILQAAVDVDPSTEHDKSRFSPSFIGLILQRLPVGVQAGMLVFYGLVLGLETISIICAAVVQTAIPFVTLSPNNPNDTEMAGPSFEATAESKARTMRSLEFFCRNCESDLIASIYVFLEWKRRRIAGEEVDAWAEEVCVSTERLVAIDELVVHLHNEIRAFFPCQSYISQEDGIIDALSLQKQLKVHQPILLWMICVTFAGNAVQVKQIRNESRKQVRESGTPMFLQRAPTHSDGHIPSVVTPWRLGHTVVPVSITVSEGRNTVAIQQCVANSQFLLLLILLFPVIRYGSTLLDDSQGTYRAFSVTINGFVRRIRCPAAASALVLEFRTQFNNCVSALRYRRQHSHVDDVSFVNYLQEHTQDAMGNCFSLLRSRVHLMTQLWNAMRDPASMPVEMLLTVPLDEEHVFRPKSLMPQSEPELEPLPTEGYQYPDFMREWSQGRMGWPTMAWGQQQQQAGMYANLAHYQQMGMGMGHPGLGMQPALLQYNQLAYVQPHQPLPTDASQLPTPEGAAAGALLPPGAKSDPTLTYQDMQDQSQDVDLDMYNAEYAIFRQRGPLVEESSDDEA